MSLVRGQTGLRRYVASALAALLTVYIGVAALVLHFRHQGDVPERIVAVLAGAYLVAVLSNSAAVGLAGLSNRILTGHRAEAAQGWRLAGRRLPQVAGWALLVVVVGIPARLITSWGVDQLAAVLLGFSTAVISFFAIPAIALMGDGPLRAGRRSLGLINRFWAGQVAGMVYVWLRPILLFGLPGAAALVVGLVLERNGADLLGWTVGAAGAVALATAYLFDVSSRSILSVVLFRFAEDGSVPDGFDAARLDRLMRGPTPLVERFARRLDGEHIRRLRTRLRDEREML